MGTYVFKLPDIGEGVVEGEITAWHVAVGDSVSEDQPMVDVMTDKATVSIPSPVNGKITTMHGGVGDMIAVGGPMIELEIDGDGNVSAENEVVEAEVAEEVITEPVTKAAEEKPLPAEPSNAPAPVVNSSGRALASPAVRRRATESGIDLSKVPGGGPAGRVRHADLDAFIASGGSMSTPAAPSGVARTGTTEHPVVGLRRKIAEQMVISKTNIPHFSYFEEIDVTELETLRQHLNSTKSPEQPKLTYLPFIMLALAKIMPHHPECNAIFNEVENKVIRHEAIHLGIATSTDRGLFVPVVKHVEAMDAWSAAAEMQRVSGACRDGTASMEDLAGSTFTITSLGRDGGLGATPIINHPEVGILGVHKAREMPVVLNGQIVIRRIMNVSSSWDHRVVDGADGAALVQHLKRLLEHPALIFM
ncbi:MAG: dihydrolipoamide acetyltransferase family protein [Candidatus Thalassarchaeaceae archaeon]|nr:dihydrolipoamide acetyltransferase family protein [Candidatus Thalassarchaeaceae archaeon]